MSSIPAGEDVLPRDEPTYDLPTVAQLLGLPITRVHQQLKDGHLLAVRRHGVPTVPQIFFTDDGEVVKHLPGLLAVLRDGGYRHDDILRWLFRPDDSLTISRDGSSTTQPNARPVDALHSHQAREVIRRAQALAY